MRKSGAKKWGRRDVRPRFDHGDPIAKIDTRPIVFVAFILVALSMLSASQIRQHALMLDLVATERFPELGPDVEFPVLGVAEDGKLSWNGDEKSPQDFAGLLRVAVTKEPYAEIILHPDDNASYEDVAMLMRQIWVNAGERSLPICLSFDETHVKYEDGPRRIGREISIQPEVDVDECSPFLFRDQHRGSTPSPPPPGDPPALPH